MVSYVEATTDDRVSRDLGQTLIVVLDGHEDPSTIRPLLAEHGIGNLIIECSGAPGLQ